MNTNEENHKESKTPGHKRDAANNSSSTRDIEMRWQEIEKDFKSHYPELSEEDLKYRDGEFNQMIERIGKQTNKTPQEVRDKIWEWDSDRFESGNDSDRT